MLAANALRGLFGGGNAMGSGFMGSGMMNSGSDLALEQQDAALRQQLADADTTQDQLQDQLDNADQQLDAQQDADQDAADDSSSQDDFDNSDS